MLPELQNEADPVLFLFNFGLGFVVAWLICCAVTGCQASRGAAAASGATSGIEVGIGRPAPPWGWSGTSGTAASAFPGDESINPRR